MSERDEAAISVQESILADLEELVIGTQFRPKRTVEEAVYHRIAGLKKTIKLLKGAKVLAAASQKGERET